MVKGFKVHLSGVQRAKINNTTTFFENRQKIIEFLALNSEKVLNEEASCLFAPPYH